VTGSVADEQALIRGHLLLERPLDEVALTLGLSESRAGELRRRARRRLERGLSRLLRST